MNKETGLAQIAEVHMKGMKLVSPETCIFTYIDAKFLNLIPDL